jgi:processing peptidase subunit beta
MHLTLLMPYCHLQDMAVAAVGDVQFMPDYNFFRRRSYWLRY